MSDTNEFSRLFDVRQCEGKQAHIEANEAERAALAVRFGIVRIERLVADVILRREDRVVEATGSIEADVVQACAVSAEDLSVAIREDLAVRFVPEVRTYGPDEEIELSAEDYDEIEYSGAHFDLGEAVAQTVALAIDPFATGPEADKTRQRPEFTEEEDLGPFAALKGLKLP